MPTKCFFVLENPQLVYYTGDHIYGRLRFSTTKRLKCEAISLAFVGFGLTNWVEFDRLLDYEHNDCERVKSKRILSGQEDYIYCRLNLKGKTVLETGTTDEEFCIIVPDFLPSSTKQEHGEIAYKLVVNLKRPTKCSKIFEQNIHIKKTMDLSGNRFFFVPFSSEANGICFTTNSTGFTPGQIISYTVRQNGSNPVLYSFEDVKIGLFQAIIYTSQQPYIKKKRSERLIRTGIFEQGNQNRDALIQFGALQIPLTLPISSECHTNQVVKIAYFLEAFIHSPKKKVMHKLRIPITIGTKVPRGLYCTSENDGEFFCYDNPGISDLSLEDLTIEGEQLDLSSTRFKTVPYK